MSYKVFFSLVFQFNTIKNDYKRLFAIVGSDSGLYARHGATCMWWKLLNKLGNFLNGCFMNRKYIFLALTKVPDHRLDANPGLTVLNFVYPRSTSTTFTIHPLHSYVYVMLRSVKAATKESSAKIQAI